MSNKQSDELLAQKADSGLRGQGAIVEMMSRLKASIIRLDETSTKQQKEVIKLTKSIRMLTWAIFGLTIILVVIGCISVLPILFPESQ
jgi:hypothetical protein